MSNVKMGRPKEEDGDVLRLALRCSREEMAEYRQTLPPNMRERFIHLRDSQMEIEKLKKSTGDLSATVLSLNSTIKGLALSIDRMMAASAKLNATIDRLTKNKGM